MNFTVSNCCFPADAILGMATLPPEFGIEIQIEYGTDYYWKCALSRLMKDRTGGLSIHGQFFDIDLSAEDLDEKELFDYYLWAFELYNRYGAEHFAIHPDGKITAPKTEAEIAQMRLRATDRIARVTELAKREGVNLLAENLRPKGYGMVFDQNHFVELFDQIPDLNCLIDTGHMYLSGWDFHAVLSQLSNRIRSYHINDTFGLEDEHLPVGRGRIDWGAFFADYKKYTPNAEMVLEYKGTSVDDIVSNANLIRTLMK